MTKPIHIIIPALNEAKSIGQMIEQLKAQPYTLENIIVVNNGSTDDTAVIAKNHGAVVIDEPQSGYGNACLAGIAYINKHERIDHQQTIIVFIDADCADDASALPTLVDPIFNNSMDFVLGWRRDAVDGSLTIVQKFGNKLATKLIRWIYNFEYHDLGPFRAIRQSSLNALNMVDRNYGWTVEMQIKALQQKLRIQEIPVRYFKRIGQSKVSGTVKGTVSAGYKIIYTILKYALWSK